MQAALQTLRVSIWRISGFSRTRLRSRSTLAGSQTLCSCFLQEHARVCSGACRKEEVKFIILLAVIIHAFLPGENVLCPSPYLGIDHRFGQHPRGLMQRSEKDA
jgi:hypothetical protein